MGKNFRMIGERKEVGLKAILNKKGTIIAKFGQAEVEISVAGQPVKRYSSSRNFTENPDGAMVIPYFYKDGQWMVVIVRQFRIALADGKEDDYETLEAVAGEAYGDDKKVCMAAELKEEAGILVDPSKIKMVACEFHVPSSFSDDLYSGIVEIEESQIPKEILAGEWFDGEYTIVEIHPLVELLRARNQGGIKLDVWTARVLDEVAKQVGLLVKNY